MPVKTPRDEEKWQKAKDIAAEAGQAENYAYIMGIYKKMKPDYEFKTAQRIAQRWVERLADEISISTPHRVAVRFLTGSLYPETGSLQLSGGMGREKGTLWKVQLSLMPAGYKEGQLVTFFKDLKKAERGVWDLLERLGEDMGATVESVDFDEPILDKYMGIVAKGVAYVRSPKIGGYKILWKSRFKLPESWKMRPSEIGKGRVAIVYPTKEPPKSIPRQWQQIRSHVEKNLPSGKRPHITFHGSLFLVEAVSNQYSTFLDEAIAAFPNARVTDEAVKAAEEHRAFLLEQAPERERKKDIESRITRQKELPVERLKPQYPGQPTGHLLLKEIVGDVTEDEIRWLYSSADRISVKKTGPGKFLLNAFFGPR